MIVAGKTPPDDPLVKLVGEIRACRHCRDLTDNPLPHEPGPVLQVSSEAKIMVCGQAPGIRVHKSGRPFTDPSGDRLRSWMGVDETVFYDPQKLAIVPMGFCFPGYDKKGGDLPPRRECRALWHKRLVPLLPKVRLILMIGKYAQDFYLPQSRHLPLSERVSNWRMSAENPSGPAKIPLPHPSWRNNAWLKRNLWFENEVLPVVRDMVSRLV